MSKKQANLVCLIVAAIWGGGFIATDAALQKFEMRMPNTLTPLKCFLEIVLVLKL